MSERLVIIPTYNEKENIRLIVQAVFELPVAFDVLIVDDSSPDGTGDIVRQLQEQYTGLHLLERKTKDGLGRAYLAGFGWALDRAYRYICEMDADFSHTPADLIRLVDACSSGKGDLAVGSRYVKGGKVINWTTDRKIWSRGGSIYTKLITWMPVNDATAGFVCYKREVLEAIELDEVRFNGYAFQIEMKYTAHRLGFKIVEVPITFKDRELGETKFNGSIISEAVLGVLKLRFKKIRRRKEMS